MPRYEYSFTVFTPTFNRAATLQRGYSSLSAQTYRNFEWLIVDDGSTDGTADLVHEWQREANFPIQYIYKSNGGKHTAINRGVQAARGELFLFLDSDDACLPHSLERYKHHWDSIPAKVKDQFSAVSALTQTPDGKVVGSHFPYHPMDSNSLDIHYRYKVTGEKRGFHRTDVLRQFPHPRFERENILPDSLLWYRIALLYKTRYVNEPLMVYYQTPGQMSSHGFLLRAQNPQGARFYYKELIGMNYPFPYTALLHEYANYVRFSLHAGVSVREQLRQAPSYTTCLIAWPLGYAVYQRDLQHLKAFSSNVVESIT